MLTHKKWRSEYLRLLTEGPKHGLASGSAEELEEFRRIGELIDEGYIKGKFVEDSGRILTIAYEGPTISGRLFAEELEEHAKKKTFWYRAKTALVLIVTWIAGIISAVVASWLGKSS